MTHSSPSRTALVDMFTGSEPACIGSVIENPERIRPSRSGRSQRSFCSAVPNIASTSELPESGAWFPKICGAHVDMPSISCIRPSFTWPKPCPPRSGGRWAAHIPCFFTSSWRDRTIALKFCSSVSSTSSGKISSRTNSRIHSSFLSNSGSVEKSQAIVRLPWSTVAEELVRLGDEVHDCCRALLVNGVWTLAPPVQHQVVAEDARVLVIGEGEVPAKLVRVGVIHVQQDVVRH